MGRATSVVLGAANTSRLNLTAANHVFLMEPQWNPMLEEQALDRVYRIGQTKEVTTVRYIVQGTLETVCYNCQNGFPFETFNLTFDIEHSSSAVEEKKSG